ncbi:MAG TPA: hypothetical protein VIJ16_00030 [Gemmatimonadaceae bacterium]
MFRRLSTIATAALALTAFAGTAQAQATCGNTAASNATCSPAGVTVSTTVQNIVYMSIDVAGVALTAPTDADFTGGGTTTKTDLAKQVITVRANAAWTLTLAGAAWTAPYVKSVGDLSWTKDGSTWTAMTTSAASVTTGTATGGSTTTIGYKTAWDLSADKPGTYTMALAFTLSAP